MNASELAPVGPVPEVTPGPAGAGRVETGGDAHPGATPGFAVIENPCGQRTRHLQLDDAQTLCRQPIKPAWRPVDAPASCTRCARRWRDHERPGSEHVPRRVCAACRQPWPCLTAQADPDTLIALLAHGRGYLAAVAAALIGGPR